MNSPLPLKYLKVLTTFETPSTATTKPRKDPLSRKDLDPDALPTRLVVAVPWGLSFLGTWPSLGQPAKEWPGTQWRGKTTWEKFVSGSFNLEQRKQQADIFLFTSQTSKRLSFLDVSLSALVGE